MLFKVTRVLEDIHVGDIWITFRIAIDICDAYNELSIVQNTK